MPKVHFCHKLQCPDAEPIFRYATGTELSRALAHVRTYRHQRKCCKYGTNCTCFTRHTERREQETLQSFSQLQIEYAEAHCLTYHHGVDMHPFENESFSTFQAIPRPACLPTFGGCSIRREAETNGYGDVWTTPDGGNLQEVVHAKLGHPIHTMHGSPLCQEEMLALIYWYRNENSKYIVNGCSG